MRVTTILKAFLRLPSSRQQHLHLKIFRYYCWYRFCVWNINVLSVEYNSHLARPSNGIICSLRNCSMYPSISLNSWRPKSFVCNIFRNAIRVMDRKCLQMINSWCLRGKLLSIAHSNTNKYMVHIAVFWILAPPRPGLIADSKASTGSAASIFKEHNTSKFCIHADITQRTVLIIFPTLKISPSLDTAQNVLST